MRGFAVAGGRLLAATHKGEILCFAPQSELAGKPFILAETSKMGKSGEDKVSGPASAIADILRRDRLTGGFALVAEAPERGSAVALAAKTELSVLQLVADAVSCDALRANLLSTTAYHGSRIAVLPRDRLGDFPDYFANVIVADGAMDQAAMAGLYRVLHPYTGRLYIVGPSPNLASTLKAAGISETAKPVANGVVQISRGALPVGESEARAPFQMLWFGGPGPNRMADRHIINAPRPQGANGRVFVTGAHDVFAFDAFNGRELWSVPVGKACVREADAYAPPPGSLTTAVGMQAGDDVLRLDLGARVFVDLDARDGRVLHYYNLNTNAPGHVLDGPRTFEIPGSAAPTGKEATPAKGAAGGTVKPGPKPPQGRVKRSSFFVSVNLRVEGKSIS